MYIEDNDPTSKKTAMEAIVSLNEYERTASIAELEKLFKENESLGEGISKECAEKIKAEVISKIYPIKDYKLSKQITDAFSHLRYDIVLNMQQH